MRFASADVDDVPHLFVELSVDRFAAVIEIERAMPMTTRIQPSDVADLIRADPHYRTALAAAISAVSETIQTKALSELTLGPPVRHPRSIVCVGRNYLDHVAEGEVDVPAFPVLFAKFPNALIGASHVVPEHAIATQLDYEGEVALVIGRRASKVAASDAMSYVAGYTALNDISARDLQAGDLQWIRGKSLDGYAPCGPTFVTADEVPDVKQLRVTTRVNGEVRQKASVAEMIFPIPQLISFITEAITLQPGDLVATGTPAGTAIGMTPPKFLRSGDRVDVDVTHVGQLTSYIGRSR